jgi:hypothetical protein
MLMKKLLLTCTALLVLAAFSAPAQALPICFKFVDFCDGVCVNHEGINTASWYHFDCASDSPMDASRKGHYTSNCGTDGSRIVRSTAGNGPGAYYFVVDLPYDGTMDMLQGTYPNGSCWIPDRQYDLQMGAPHDLEGGNQSRSSIQ